MSTRANELMSTRAYELTSTRIYDSLLGRWHVVDKLADEPEQLDKSVYQYGWNAPINLTDPDGNCPMCVGALVGASVASSNVFSNFAPELKKKNP